MRLFQTCLLLLFVIFFTFCSKDNDKDLTSLDEVVKIPIRSVSGEVCSVCEDDVFEFNGKKSFSECEIRQNPEIFNGKIIRVKTNYGSGKHGGLLTDWKECSGVLNSVNEPIAARFMSKKDFDYIDKMNIQPVNIVAVGKFSLKTPSRKSDLLSDNTPFDFNIMCLEKAEKLSR